MPISEIDSKVDTSSKLAAALVSGGRALSVSTSLVVILSLSLSPSGELDNFPLSALPI